MDEFLEVRKKIAEDVHRYLNDPANRKTIFSWDDHVLPDGNVFLAIQLRAFNLIDGVIMKVIDNQIAEHERISEMQIEQLDDLSEKMKKEEDKIKHFLRTMVDDKTPEEDPGLTFFTEALDHEMSKGQVAALVITAPLWIPLGIVSFVTVLPVAALVLKIREKINMRAYKKNKTQQLDEWSTQLLKEVYTLNTLEQIIYQEEMKKTDEKLERCSKSIKNYKHILKTLNRREEIEVAESGYAELTELRHQLEVMLCRSVE